MFAQDRISVVLPVTMYSFKILSVPTDLFFFKKRPLNNNVYINKSVFLVYQHYSNGSTR